MSQRRNRPQRKGLSGRNQGAHRRGRLARRLSLEPVFLEDRILLTTLSQVIDAFNLGMGELYGGGSDGQGAASFVTQALGTTWKAPLLTQVSNLESLLQNAGIELGTVLADAFQFGEPTSLLPDTDSWSTLVGALEQTNTGLTVLYPQAADWTDIPTVGTTAPFEGDYLMVQWQPPAGLVSSSSSPLSLSIGDFGDTGLPYLDSDNSGSLQGSLSGSVGAVQAQVTMGVDDSGPNGTPVFFLSAAPSGQYGTYLTVPNITAKGSVSGQTSIGDLADVSITGTGSLNITSATLAFQGDKSNPTELHITSTGQSIGVTGNIVGSLQLSATLGAEIPPLPELDWTGTFQDSINGTTFGTPQYQLQEPSAGSILSALGSQLLDSLADFSPLGSLESQLEEPLPLVNESIAQLTGLNADLPKFPSISLGSLDPSNAISVLESLGIEINDGNTSPAALATMINNLLHGQYVDLVSWSKSGDVPLLDFSATIPIFSLGVPGIVSAEIDATFGADADLKYQLGFGLDTNGFWIQARSGIGLDFDLNAGIEGQVEIFGIPLASAGGNIGFDISPSVSLSPDPYSNVPGRDYVSDLMSFGPNLGQDLLDAMSESLEGSLTGTLYASLDLLFFSFSASFGINIPVFDFQHNPIWPGQTSPGSTAPPSWPVTDTGGVVTFSDTTSGANNDDLALSEGPNGSLTITWKGHKSPVQGANGPDSMTFPNATSFKLYANGGQDQLTSAQGFDIPIFATASPGQSSPVYFQGGNANSTLIGGGGNDTLVGGGGDDFIQAGSGNDLISGGQKASTLIGGSGADTIYGGAGNDVIDGGSGAYDIEGGGGNDTIYGGQGHAELQKNGTMLYPAIHGGDGHVLIIDMSEVTANQYHYPTSGSAAIVQGFSGFGVDPYNSAITIGPTADDPNPTRIYCDGGSDTIYGGSGGDMIVAGAGPSVIYGGAGNDSIRGGFGPDTIYGGPGSNSIEGGVGNATIYGGDGDNVNGAGAGDGQSSGSNLLIGGSGNNLIFGDSKGNDTILGGTGNDTLYAGAGEDYLDGGSGADALYGGPGADTFVVHFNPAGGTEQDTLQGGTGNATLLLQGPPGQDNHIDLTSVPGTTETYTASLYNLDTSAYDGAVSFTLPPSIPQLSIDAGTGHTAPGVPANDEVVVDPSVQEGLSIFGGDGNNTLIAGSGDDTLVGGLGNNLLVGGGGDDMLYGDPSVYPADDPTQVKLPSSSTPASAKPGNDTLIGGSGDSQLFAGGGSDLLIGGDASQVNGVWVLQSSAANDLMYGGAGADLMIAGPGSTGAQMFAGSGQDTLVGGDASDVLVGGDGSDLLLGGNTQNIMIGDLGGTTGNTTMVGGVGFDTMIGSNGSDVLFQDDTTPQAQAYWTQTINIASTEFNVQLVQPPNPLAGLTTIPQLLKALAQYQTEEVQLEAQLTQLESLRQQYLNDNETVPPSLVAQIADVDNEFQGALSELSIIATGLYPPGAPAAPVDASFILGGSGMDTIYGGSAPAKLVGGGGHTTFFDQTAIDQNDTLTGGSGGVNTVVFEDIAGQPNQITFADQPPNGLVINLTGQNGQLQPISLANISNMQFIGVELLGTNDSLTMDTSQRPTLGGNSVGIQVLCGPGSDTIEETASTTPQPWAVTINGGSGADLVEVDSDLPTQPIYAPLSTGAGTSELEINGVGSAVTVQVGTGNQSGLLLVDKQPVGSQAAYSSLKVVGTPSSSTPILNSMGPIGSIPNVTLQGGNGPDVTNNMFAAGATITLIGGDDGATNNITATGGTSELTGGQGTNTFKLVGPGDYDVQGAASQTNALVLQGDNFGDTINLIQNGGGTIVVTGTLAATATNITSVSVTGGSGNDDINASGMSMAVTLNGGGGTDTLIGGAGDNTLYYDGPQSVYDGGSGSDNELVYQASNGGDIVLLPDVPAGYKFAVDLDGSEADINPVDIDSFRVLSPTGTTAAYGVGDTFFSTNDWTSSTANSQINVTSSSITQEDDQGYYLSGTDDTQALVAPRSIVRTYFEQDCLFTGYSYDPATQGSITGIEPSFTVSLLGISLYFPNMPYINPPYIDAMLEQGGKTTTHGLGYQLSGTNGDEWVSTGYTSYLSSSAFVNDGSSPNFTNGGPIQFGFYLWVNDSNAGGSDPFPVNNFTWGVKDFQALINRGGAAWTPWAVNPVIPPLSFVGASVSGGEGVNTGFHGLFEDLNASADPGLSITWLPGVTTEGTVYYDIVDDRWIGFGDYALPYGTYQIVATLSDPAGPGISDITEYTGGVELSSGNLDNVTPLYGATPLDSDVQSYVISNIDDAVFDLHSDGTLWSVTEVNDGTPYQLASDVQSMQLSPDGVVFALSDGTLLGTNGYGAEPVPGADDIQSFAVEDSGNVYAASGGTLFEFPEAGPAFQAVSLTVADSSGVEAVFPDPDGAAVDVIFNDGYAYQLQGTPGAQSWSLIATPSLVVSPQTANGQAITTITAGTPIPVTLSELTEVNGQPVTDTGYTGTVRISGDGLAGGSPPDYTFTAADEGQPTVDLTLDAAGLQTISAEDVSNNAIFGSTTVTVDPGPVSSFDILAPLSGVMAGAAATYGIAAVDAYDNTVPTYDGTVTITSTDTNSQVVLPGPTMLNSGTGSFAATLDTAGNQTITATDTSNSTLQGSGQVAVSPAPVFGQVGITLPPGIFVGSGWSVDQDGNVDEPGVSAPTGDVIGVGEPFVVTLTMEDQYGNPINPSLVPGGTAPTIGFGFAAAGAFTLGSASTAFIVPASGVLAVPMTLNVAGSQSFNINYFAADPSDPSENDSFSIPVTLVGAPPSQTVVAPSANPVAAGTPVTLTATITGSGAAPPTGSVTFYDGTVLLGTGTLSTASGATTATLSVPTAPTSGTPSLDLGPQEITAVYSGDADDPPSTSGVVTVVVGQTTQTTVAAPDATPVFGQPETITATVSGKAANVVPTGTVTFQDGSTILGTATLDPGGVATLTTAALPPGAASITAVYSGDDEDLASTSTTPPPLTVGQDAVETLLTASPNTAALGQSVTLTATVSVVNPGAGNPGGTMTFAEGSTTLGTGTLSIVDGVDTATLTVPAATLGSGTDTVTASYSGDTNDGPSTQDTEGSTTVTVGTAGEVATQIAVTLSDSPVAPNAAVMLTAIVTQVDASGSSPTGMVSFYNGPIDPKNPMTNLLGTSSVSTMSGVTSASDVVSAGTLMAGDYPIAAVYSGDSADLPSTSGTVALTVAAQSANQITTQTQVIPELTYLDSGQTETLTAIVSSYVGGGVPTGTVTFYDGTMALGMATLSAPSASQGNGLAANDYVLATLENIPSTDLTDGANSITAAYSPDSPGKSAGYQPSTSAQTTVTLDQATTTTVAVTSSSSGPVFTSGQPVTFTATVTVESPGTVTPTGSVRFEDDGAVIGTAMVVPVVGETTEVTATYQTSSLPLAAQSVTAVYGGDQSNQGSTSPPVDFAVGSLKQNVTQTTLTATPGPLTVYQPVTLQAKVNIVVAATTNTASDTPTGTITFLDGSTPLGSLGSAFGGVTVSFTTPLILNGLTILDTQTLDTAAGGAAETFTALSNGSTTAGSAAVSVANGATMAMFSTTVDYTTSTGTATAIITGTLTVSISNGVATALCSVTLNGSTVTESSMLGTSNGALIAMFKTTTLADGPHSITAIYSGDADNLASTAPPLSFQVGQTATGTQVPDTSLAAGQPLVAQIIGPGTPTGTVTFDEITTNPDGTQQATTLGTAPVSADSASLNVSLPLGSYTIDAQYSGDANDLPSDSGQVSIGVNQNLAVVSLTSSASAVVANQTAVTLLATVTVESPGSGIPTGSIEFSDNVGSLDSNTPVPLTIVSGVATATLSGITLPAGPDTILATYVPPAAGPADTEVASPASIVVNGDSTATGGTTATQTSVSAPTVPAFGQPVSLTATVSGGSSPSGGVDFFDTGTDGSVTYLGTASLGAPDSHGNAAATLAAQLSNAGPNSITAIYTGDGTNVASASAESTITVPQAATEATIEDTGSGYSTQPDEFTSSVTEQNGGAGALEGTVTFYASPFGSGASGTENEIGTANVTNNATQPGTAVAMITTATPLPTGVYAITAIYSGDGNNLGSTSTVDFAVGTSSQNATQPILSPPSVASPVFGQPEVLTATVNITVQNDPDVATPTGTVTFFDGLTNLGTATLTVSNGVATADLTTSALPAGSSNSISAVYNGDASDILSFSSPMSITVMQAATTTAVSASTSTAVVGEPVTLTASVTEPVGQDGVLTGSVTFSDGSTVLGTSTVVDADGAGTAALVTTALTLGDPSITAAYAGDANNLPSQTNTPMDVTVSQDSTDVALVASPSSEFYGQTETFTAIVALLGPGSSNPTGSVTFRNGTVTLGTGTLSTTAGVTTATYSSSTMARRTYSVTAQYGGDSNDEGSSSNSAGVTVNAASPAVSVNPVNLSYGTALANGQLSGTATSMLGGKVVAVPGSFRYTSAAGMVLDVGNGRIESVTFTPTDSTDYNTAGTPVTVNVARASPKVSVNPVSLTAGAALENSQLSGTVTWTVGGKVVIVPGSFRSTSAAGTVPSAGNGQSESATFTPTNSTDYTTVTTTVIVNVAAPPVPLVTVKQVYLAKLNKKHQVTEVFVVFSGPVDSTEADQKTGIYRLATAGKHGSYTAKNAGIILLKSATYTENGGVDSVALIPKKPFALTKPVQLLINGLPPAGLQDSDGRYIDGDGNGTPGGNAIAIIAKSGETVNGVSPARTAARTPVRATAVIDALLARGELAGSRDSVRLERAGHHQEK